MGSRIAENGTERSRSWGVEGRTGEGGPRGDRADSFPSPADFGLPAKFTGWREGQWEGVNAAIDSDRRFVVQAAPTGSGKSVLAVSQAVLTGARCVYLTSTKGLQEQLRDDFSEIGLLDIRGQANYPCELLQPGGRFHQPNSPTWIRGCDFGPCHGGYECSSKEHGCSYFDAYRTAKRGKLIVTNYPYWLSINEYGEGLGDFDLLICDEAHGIADSLGDFLTVELTSHEIEGILGVSHPGEMTIEKWRSWAAKYLPVAQDLLATLKGSSYYSRVRETKQLVGKLERIQQMAGEWVTDGKMFAPVWAAPYREMLFQGVKKVTLVSATVRPKTCELIGVQQGERDFFEYDSSFPVERRPVIHVPTIRLNHRTADSELLQWVRRIDQIIDARLDRKGIIHTVSYSRRNFLLEHTRHKGLMITHDSRNTADIVDRFKESAAPCVLVSPSMSTGYDFPGEQCEYSIIGKLAYPDTRGVVMQARIEKDKEYAPYIAAQELVQACGRGMRSEQDRHECLIVDDNIGWFMSRYRDFMPRWFVDSFKVSRTIPKPLPKL